MLFFSTLTLPATILAFSTFALAAPTKPAGTIAANLIGAADAHFTVDIPFNGEYTPITNPLSISHIATTGGPCSFFGIDGVVYKAASAGKGDVGPPQTIVGAQCGGQGE